MREPKPVQKPAAFRMFRNGNHRAPVLICKPKRLLDCAHYSDTSQVRLQLRTEIDEKLAIILLANHADDAGRLRIQVANRGAHRALVPAALVFLEFHFAEFAEREDIDDAKMILILRKTWKKMTERGHAAALELDFPGETGRLVQEALA